MVVSQSILAIVLLAMGCCTKSFLINFLARWGNLLVEAMAKFQWSRSMRARMALTMSVSCILPIVICHVIVTGTQGLQLLDLAWYLPLLPILMVINWFLAGVVLIPIRQLLQATTKLATMDLRQRLGNDPS